MKRSLLALLLSTLCACSARNTVADDNRTPSERLASEASASCASICDWAVKCPVPPCDCSGDDCACVKGPDSATCPTECAKMVADYQGRSDACASVGLGILDCLSHATCADLYQHDLCAPAVDETTNCGADIPTANVPPSAGSGGSANTGPNPVIHTGSAGSGAQVHCETGYGGGVAGSGNIGGSTVSCELGYELCADGHTYYALCVSGGHAELACSCFLDGTLQTSFTPSVACPAAPEINARCHWSVEGP